MSRAAAAIEQPATPSQSAAELRTRLGRMFGALGSIHKGERAAALQSRDHLAGRILTARREGRLCSASNTRSMLRRWRSGAAAAPSPPAMRVVPVTGNIAPKLNPEETPKCPMITSAA
jgi:hypothetical protein